MNANINYQSFSESTDVGANAFGEPLREITNKVTGDRMKLIHSPADGFGSVKIEFTLPPDAPGAPLHYHLNFVEKFAVTDGRLEMRIGNESRIVAPDEAITVPIGVPHSFKNSQPDSVTFTTEVAPAAEFEKFVHAMYGLANDGKTSGAGMPTNFLHLALILDYADLYFPVVPSSLQTLMRRTLAKFARIVGAEKSLLKYYAARN